MQVDLCSFSRDGNNLNISQILNWRSEPTPLLMFHSKYNNVYILSDWCIYWTYDFLWVIGIIQKSTLSSSDKFLELIHPFIIWFAFVIFKCVCYFMLNVFWILKLSWRMKASSMNVKHLRCILINRLCSMEF